MTITVDGVTVVDSVAAAQGYIAKVCFKTGPPQRLGVELEWTVHHVDDPARPLDLSLLAAALGRHAPRTLVPTSQMTPLPGGSLVTVEPGGQVELSAPPASSPDHLHSAVEADISALSELLAARGLGLGRHGIDPHRLPAPAIRTPRYAAMLDAFSPYGPHGPVMMTNTAGLQVCLDAGTAEQVAGRWRAVHTLGPPLLAAFANSRRHAGTDTGWSSARMRAWLGLDQRRTGAVWRPDAVGQNTAAGAAAAWAGYALAAPLLCVRRPDGNWAAPPETTFADWIAGALPVPPTHGDLAYHLSTLFPPVRPRGYLEVRYLDTQPPGEWLAPVAVLDTLLADPAIIAEAERRAAPAIGRWEAAARCGVADPGVAVAARGLLRLALDNLDARWPTRAALVGIIRRRLAEAGQRIQTANQAKPAQTAETTAGGAQ
jgi:glutamate--cysteine ligase